MLAGATMTRMPADIERGREDFKLYMRELKKRGRDLDTFMAGDKRADAHNPPNFAWRGDAPNRKTQTAHPDDDNNDTFEREAEAQIGMPPAGRSTGSHEANPPNFAWEGLHNKDIDKENRNIDLIHEEQEMDNAPDDDAWKKMWAERHAKGSLATDYQQHFKWPPATAYKHTHAHTHTHAHSVSPSRALKDSNFTERGGARSAIGGGSRKPVLEKPTRTEKPADISQESQHGLHDENKKQEHERSAAGANLSARSEVWEGSADTEHEHKDDADRDGEHRSTMPSPLALSPHDKRDEDTRFGKDSLDELYGKINSAAGSYDDESIPNRTQSRLDPRTSHIDHGHANTPVTNRTNKEGHTEHDITSVRGDNVPVREDHADVVQPTIPRAKIDQVAGLIGGWGPQASLHETGAKKNEEFSQNLPPPPTQRKTVPREGGDRFLSEYQAAFGDVTQILEEDKKVASRAPFTGGNAGIDHVAQLWKEEAETTWKPSPPPPPRLPVEPADVASAGRSCGHALRKIGRMALAELASFRTPASSIVDVVRGGLIALGYSGVSRDWTYIKQLLHDTTLFLRLRDSFDKDSSHITTTSLAPFTQKESLKPKNLRHMSKAAYLFACFLEALYEYKKLIEGGQGGEETTHIPRTETEKVEKNVQQIPRKGTKVSPKVRDWGVPTTGRMTSQDALELARKGRGDTTQSMRDTTPRGPVTSDRHKSVMSATPRHQESVVSEFDNDEINENKRREEIRNARAQKKKEAYIKKKVYIAASQAGDPRIHTSAVQVPLLTRVEKQRRAFASQRSQSVRNPILYNQRYPPVIDKNRYKLSMKF